MSIWFNGEIVEDNLATASVLSHGLHYGTSVFEGIRLYQGKIFRLEEHSVRLKNSAELLGFEIPYSVAEINDAIERLIQHQQLLDGYIRPVAWLGHESLALNAPGNKVHLAIAAWDWPELFDAEKRHLGISMTLSPVIRNHPKAVPVAAKAGGNYLNSCLAMQQARKAGFDEALLTDYEGYVAEATGANIFFVKNGALITPEPDRFLNGITRQTVIELARTLGLDVIARRISVHELADFEHAFLTGTAYGVLPVSQIDNLNYQPSEITAAVIKHYRNLCLA